MLLESYYNRIDLAAFHASFINSKSKHPNASVRRIIGDRPWLSDEIEDQQLGENLLKIFKKIFPPENDDYMKKPQAAAPEVEQ